MMMMTTITEHQARLLAQLVHELRPEWDERGLAVAIHRARTLGTAADVTVALVQLAGNPDARTPGLLAMPGIHWRGTKTSRVRRDPMCHDHPEQPAGRCATCAAESVPRPLDLAGFGRSLAKRAGR